MTKNLLYYWNVRLEIIPRDSISVLNNAATNLHTFVIENNMNLNTTMWKEMLKSSSHMTLIIGESLSVIIEGGKRCQGHMTNRLFQLRIPSKLSI